MLPIYCSEGERQKLRMKNAFIYIKTYIFRGLIAVIPLALTVFVIQFLYLAIDQRIMGLVDEFIGFRIPGLGIVLQLNVLYLIGFIASNVVSRKIFGFAERITERIPLINTTYHVGKQLSATLSLPERQVFKRVVLVEYLKPGIWTIGFVTGNIIDILMSLPHGSKTVVICKLVNGKHCLKLKPLTCTATSIGPVISHPIFIPPRR